MLDTISIKIPITSPVEFWERSYEPFEFKGFTFLPLLNKEGIPTRYRSLIGNINLFMIEDTLFIKNSLHKFQKGNNYSPFTFSEIKESIAKLENTLGMNLMKGEIKKLSYGCVIPEETEKVFKDWNYYRVKEFLPMEHRGVQYGNKCKLTDFHIKAYNKTFEVQKHNNLKLNDSLLRYEIEVINMRYLTKQKNQIPIFEVKDILKKDNLNLLTNDLLLKYSLIEKTMSMDLLNLSLNQKQALAMMPNKDFRDNLRLHHNKTYKRYKKTYQNLLNQAENENYHSIIGERIKDKCEELLNG